MNNTDGKMRVAVVGTGGVGGYFGGLLAHSGQDVTFIARGAHLAAIHERGLEVHSVLGDFKINPAQATDDMTAVESVDLALVCVKNYHLDEIAQQMRPLVGKNTVILPLLNGVEAPERLAAVFGQERVLGGLCAVFAYIAEPGVIEHKSQFGRVIFGELDGRNADRAQAIHAAFEASGAEVELVADIWKALWTKFLFITAYSGVASVVRLPVGAIQASPETMDLIRAAMAEIETVGRAHGVAWDEDVLPRALAMVDGLAPTATASMQRDVEASKQFELEALTGAVLRYGAKVGVETPLNQSLYALLKPHLP